MNVVTEILRVVSLWWWVLPPIILAIIFFEFHERYKKKLYSSSLEWVLLQITIPQEILKTPLAMEQAFATLHSLLGQGDVQDWLSFEIRSAAGTVYFYVRTPRKHRDLVESALYSQYPEAEIIEAEDYSALIASEQIGEYYDITGGEFILEKADAYPIKTYSEFRFEVEESKRFANVDPMAVLVESLSRLGEGEEFWLQLRVEPTDDKWKKDAEGVIKELMGEEKKKPDHFAALKIVGGELGEIGKELITAPFGGPGESEEKKEEKKEKERLPGATAAIEAISRATAKLGFKSTIRTVYVAQKERFNKGRFGTVTAAFKQLSTQNLNALKLNKETTPKGGLIFTKHQELVKKQGLLQKYQKRAKPAKDIIFNTEELATIFHFPSGVITTPMLPRIETRKGEPPSSLPT